jgi:hypothetical protein
MQMLHAAAEIMCNLYSPMLTVMPSMSDYSPDAMLSARS